MAYEKIRVLRMTDALYHAAVRYEQDQTFRNSMSSQSGRPQPDSVAGQLREIARRREMIMETERTRRP